MKPTVEEFKRFINLFEKLLNLSRMKKILKINLMLCMDSHIIEMLRLKMPFVQIDSVLSAS